LNHSIASTALVADSASIGDGTSIWHFVQVRENAVIGQNCTVSKGAYIDSGVVIADNVKIQNNAQIFSPAVLSEGVFIGPGAILTNDNYPRSINTQGEVKGKSDWQMSGVVIKRGASIGAGAICVAPVVIGAWSMIGSGSVVTNDTHDFGLYVGVPARRIGWVGQSGVTLRSLGKNTFECPESGKTYLEVDGKLTEVNAE
jgi:UDP-2-acetamido-3-amino-2,3-dideoxy-glucuronate N-acetyltransferase